MTGKLCDDCRALFGFVDIGGVLQPCPSCRPLSWEKWAEEVGIAQPASEEPW